MVRQSGNNDSPPACTPLTDFIQHRTPDSPVSVRFIDSGQRYRREAEQYIYAVFARAYAANVTQFMPTLMSLHDLDNTVLAVLGLRQAAETRLFLEQYVKIPVEDRLNQVLAAFGSQVERRDIIEVGNLAATYPGGARWLIIALTAYLQGAGYHWSVFTALPGLRNSFKRLGLKVIPLAEARLEDMPAICRKNWGHYYDGKPQVVAVNVPHAYGVLDRLLRIENTLHTMHRIWRAAYANGARYLLHSATVPATRQDPEHRMPDSP